MASSHAAVRRVRSRWALAGWVAVAIVALVVAATAWIVVRGLMAKNELEKSVALVSSIRQQMASGDAVGASKTAAALAERVHSARDLTSDPIWRGAEVLPLVGPNLTAMRQLLSILSSVSDDAVVPAARLVGTINITAFKPVGGTVDMKPLIGAQPVISSATAVLQRALSDVRAIDTSDAVSQVDGAVGRLTDLLQKAADDADAVNRAVQLLPAMLGNSGPRRYLVLFQNNAELRAGGGNPGALALLGAEAGRISIEQQASSGDFPHYAKPVLPMPVETSGLYGAITGEYMQDVTLTPQFPLSAALAREMWRLRFGVSVDGVMSVDPVALSYLLSATGPIALPSGDTLTSTNAVKLLLSNAYARYKDPAQQDAFFSAAASAVFSRIAHGDFEPRAMISALVKAGSERRLLLWSAHADEQKSIAETTLAGALPAESDATKTFGVYLNDATGAKMDYYLTLKVELGQANCRQDGRPNWEVAVTLTNTAPVDAAAKLPYYVTGGGDYGVAPGNVRTNVSVYAPKSAVFLGASRAGQSYPLHNAEDSGRPVGQFQLLLKPGETTTVRIGFLGAAPFKGTLAAAMTPVVNPPVALPMDLSCVSAVR